MRQRNHLSYQAFSTVALVSALAYPVFNASNAQALQFNFGFSEGTPPEVIQGFNDAGELWGSFIADDITVDLTIQYEAFNSTSLGRFTPERSTFTYRDVVGALDRDISSPNDAVSFSSLPNSSELDVLLDPNFDFDVLTNGTSDNPNGVGSAVPYLDNDGDCNNRSIRMTTANAKALGLPRTGSGSCGSGRSNAPTSDGTITLNSNFDWDFDVSDGIDPLAYDFVGIASQGIGVMLGNISGVDVLDFNSPLLDSGEPLFFEDGAFPFVSLTDLHRFSEESASLGVIDWTTGRTNGVGLDVDKYFSIDGGQTSLASFSTGVLKGDGQRASGWKADELGGTTLGIAEPTPNSGQVLQFSNNDQILFDVIGWDLADPFGDAPSRPIKSDENPPDPKSIPEPSSAIAFVPIVLIGAKWLSKRRLPSTSKGQISK